MHNASDSTTPQGGARVLLIGECRDAVLDGPGAGRFPCEICRNVLDGIDTAGRERFAVVAVVMQGLEGRLGPVLRALRKATSARLMLLARMHEEPIARALVSGDLEDERLADGYRVCPVALASLYVCGGVRDNGQRPGATAAIGSSWPERIRYLEWLATTDDLTGLRNRRYIREFARQILDRARRTNGRVTLLVFDIDNFKHYNDVYGHATGDDILRQAAILMRRCCRSHDVVGRVGGDEFAVIFWDDLSGPQAEMARDRRSAAAEHPTEAISVAKRFRKDLGDAELPLLGPRGEGVLTISGGLASFPRNASACEQLFEQADLALLDAKRSGKNRIYLVGEPSNDIAEIE